MSNHLAKTCRTCCKEDEKATLFDDTFIKFEDKEVSALEVIGLFIDIKFTNFPNVICSDCLEKVIDIYKFKVQCEKAHNHFKLFYETFCNNAEPNEITKQEIEEISCKPTLPIEDSDIDDDIKYEDCDGLENVLKDDECIKTEDKLIRNEKCKKKYSKKKNKSGIIEDSFESLYCSQCNKTFKTKYTLSVHEKRHLYKGQFLCTICGKGFNSQSCLKRHARVHTGEKNYKCEECGKLFPSSNNLKLHSRIHSGIKPYLCSICGKSFSHPTGLTYHFRTHTKEKPYTCEVCGRSFAIQCHVDRHRKIHTGERPFPCSECDRAFIKKIDLQRHEDVHKGVKPHVCAVCNKSFLRKMHLNYHMMVHTEERPHKCPVCLKGFIRRYYLKDHINKHHGSNENTKLEQDSN